MITAAANLDSPKRAPDGRGMLALAFLLAAISALGPFSIDMYLPALPAMGQQLRSSPAAIQMTIAIFSIGSGLGQLVFGPLSDRFGRRWPAQIGLAVYVAASVGCALAMDVEQLIVARFFQALGVCSGQVVARALLADMFEPRDLARFSSLLTMITLVAPIVGPLLGGYVFSAFGWRPLFWVLAVYGAVVALVCFIRLPETRTAAAQAVSRAESALIAYQTVLRNRPLIRMGLAGAFGVCGISVYLGSASHILIEHFGIRPAHFGYYFAVNSVGLWIGASINRGLLKRREPAAILRRGCLVYLAAGLALVAGAHLPQVGKFGVLVPLFVMIGAFPTIVGNTTAIAQGHDRARAGAVAAVLGAMGGLIGAAAMAIAAALGDGTPRAMAWTIAVCAALCASLCYAGPRPRAKA